MPREAAGVGLGGDVAQASRLRFLTTAHRRDARAARQLLLLQILFDPLGLASQIRDVRVVGVDEALQVAQVLLELLGEFQVFLVAKCC